MAKGCERDDGQQEDDRQARQQDVERDLVRRLLPARALDQRDHAVEEGLAGIRGDAHDDPVGEHARAAGHGGAVAAALADHRRGLARDRRLIHRGDALDDIAVAGNQLARLDEHEVALAQLRRGDFLERRLPRDDLAVRGGEALGQRLVARAAQGIGLRLATPLRHRLGEVGEEDGEPEPERDRQDKAALARQRRIDEGAHPLDRRDDAAHLDDEHDGVARLDAWIELLERVHDGAADDLAIEERGGAAWTPRLGLPAADAAGLLWRLLPCWRLERVLRLETKTYGLVIAKHLPLEGLAGEHQQLLDDGAKRVRREVGQRADDQDHADQQPREERLVGRERAWPSGRDVLLHHGPSNAPAPAR